MITDPWVLPADVMMLPVSELPPRVRGQFEADPDDFAITRPGTRATTKIIDSGAADLLERFHSPCTIADAVVRFSVDHELDPKETLETAFPLLRELIKARFLVGEDSDDAERIHPRLDGGAEVAGFEVVRNLQVLDDTEIYQLRSQNDGAPGTTAALKIGRRPQHAKIDRLLAHEGEVLRHLDGEVGPRLLAQGISDGYLFLVLSWLEGVPLSTAAREIAQETATSSGNDRRQRLLALLQAVAGAYARLHRAGVLHGDVHPHNVVVKSDGSVDLLDFGLARKMSGARAPERGGVAYFFEPEYAAARRAGRRLPATSERGELYSLGALLYYAATGSPYLDFSLEEEQLYRQIVEEDPRPFLERGVEPWPQLETVLTRALAKEPTDRFPSVAELVAALAAIEAGSESERDPDTHAPAIAGQARDFVDCAIAQLSPEGELFRGGLPQGPRASINYGAAGISYGLLRLAQARTEPPLLALADLWWTLADAARPRDSSFYNSDIEIVPATVGRISPYHTESGIDLSGALLGEALGNPWLIDSGISRFLAEIDQPCDNLDLTLGRCSVLLASSLLLGLAPQSEPLREAGERALEEVWAEADRLPPAGEPGPLNLGIAHGWGGLLFAALRWSEASGCELPPGVLPRLEQLAACREPSGRGVRWRWLSEPSRRNDPIYMPGWCNGSGGLVHLWTLAARLLDQPHYLDLAVGAAWNAYEEPVPASNLCCGAAGRAYGLLALYRATGERAWLIRARDLAHQAAARALGVEEGEEAMYRHSLYKGALGVAVLLADLEHPEDATMPMFGEGQG